MSQHHGEMKPSQKRTWMVSTCSKCNFHPEPAFRALSRSEAGARYNEDGAKRRSMKDEDAEVEAPSSWRLGAFTPKRVWGCTISGGVGR